MLCETLRFSFKMRGCKKSHLQACRGVSDVEKIISRERQGSDEDSQIRFADRMVYRNILIKLGDLTIGFSNIQQMSNVILPILYLCFSFSMRGSEPMGGHWMSNPCPLTATLPILCSHFFNAFMKNPACGRSTYD